MPHLLAHGIPQGLPLKSRVAPGTGKAIFPSPAPGALAGSRGGAAEPGRAFAPRAAGAILDFADHGHRGALARAWNGGANPLPPAIGNAGARAVRGFGLHGLAVH